MSDLTAEERFDLIEQFRHLALLVAKPFRSRSLDRADVNQIAMLAMIQAIDTYDSSLGAMTTHIWRRVSYALWDEMKRVKRHLRSAIPLCGDVPDREEDIPPDMYRELWDAINQLSDKDRRILINRYGLTGGPALQRQEMVKQFRLGKTTITKSTNNSMRHLRAALSA